jgi:hypothetical protein
VLAEVYHHHHAMLKHRAKGGCCSGVLLLEGGCEALSAYITFDYGSFASIAAGSEGSLRYNVAQ